MLTKDRLKIITVVCGVVWIICAVMTFFAGNGYAFSQDGDMTVVVHLSETIRWISTRWFSLSSLVGLCYLLSIIVSAFMIVFALFTVVGVAKFVEVKPILSIIKIASILLCVFYTFSLVVNIIAVTSLNATFVLYILTEVLVLASLLIMLVSLFNIKTQGSATASGNTKQSA